MGMPDLKPFLLLRQNRLQTSHALGLHKLAASETAFRMRDAAAALGCLAALRERRCQRSRCRRSLSFSKRAAR